MTEELPWEYGQMLTAAVEQSGKSRREVARLAGVSPALITNLEQGFRSGGVGIRNPVSSTPDTIARIATVLKMPLRRSLEAAGLGDQIPSDMSDEELQSYFRPLIDQMLDQIQPAILLAALARRMGEDGSDNGE